MSPTTAEVALVSEYTACHAEHPQTTAGGCTGQWIYCLPRRTSTDMLSLHCHHARAQDMTQVPDQTHCYLLLYGCQPSLLWSLVFCSIISPIFIHLSSQLSPCALRTRTASPFTESVNYLQLHLPCHEPDAGDRSVTCALNNNLC